MYDCNLQVNELCMIIHLQNALPSLEIKSVEPTNRLEEDDTNDIRKGNHKWWCPEGRSRELRAEVDGSVEKEKGRQVLCWFQNSTDKLITSAAE